MNNWLRNKLPGSKRVKAEQVTGSEGLRITNETVAEHRERILASGRRFKYPLQYSKHRIVFITAGLVLGLIVLFSGLSFWLLYGLQDTSKLTERITQVLPVPIGSVDGKLVRYSDYLTELRSSLFYLTTKEAVNFSTDDGKRQLDYQKRLALNKAIENTFIADLAAQKGIVITNQQLNDFIDAEISHNALGVSEDVYKQVIKDYYDWTFDDYKDSVRKQLLKKEVVAKIDVEGRQKIEAIQQELASGKNFTDVAKAETEDPLSKDAGGDLGFVSKTTDDPNKLIEAADKLQPGQVSSVIEGVDGFYIVKLVERHDTELHIAKILVTYKTFAKQLDALRAQDKIKEFINVPTTVQPANQ